MHEAELGTMPRGLCTRIAATAGCGFVKTEVVRSVMNRLSGSPSKEGAVPGRSNRGRNQEAQNAAYWSIRQALCDTELGRGEGDWALHRSSRGCQVMGRSVRNFVP